MQIISRTSSNACIKQFDYKLLLKKLKQCILKAYCNWQPILIVNVEKTILKRYQKFFLFFFFINFSRVKDQLQVKFKAKILLTEITNAW